MTLKLQFWIQYRLTFSFLILIIFNLSCKKTFPLLQVDNNYSDGNLPKHTKISLYKTGNIVSLLEDTCIRKVDKYLEDMTIMTKADAEYFNIKIDSNYFENKGIPCGEKSKSKLFIELYCELHPNSYNSTLLFKCDDSQYVIVQYKYTIESIEDVVEEHIESYKDVFQTGNYSPETYINKEHNCNIYHVVSKIDYRMKFSIDGTEVGGTMQSNGEIWTPYKFKICSNFDSLVRTFPREQYEFMYKNKTNN